jgi:Rieske Fe-S protein
MPPEKSRRAFLTDCGKMLGTAAIAAISLPILQACEPSSIPVIEEPVDNNPVGPDGRTSFSIAGMSAANPVKVAPGARGTDGRPILLTRVSDTEYHALSMECTHQGCNVESSVIGGAIPCLCHNSQFELNGEVRQGPAENPLKSYDLILDQTAQVVRVLIT